MEKLFNIICLLLIYCTSTIAQYENIKFEHLSANQGLTQSTINCICKDTMGFMWFGTELGLKKYDGYKFTNYEHDPNKPESISGNRVKSILNDKSGSIWITTRDGGLDRFNRKSEKFFHYRISDDDSRLNETNNIIVARKDQSGNFWLLTTKNELYSFDTNAKFFKRYSPDLLSKIGTGGNYISNLYVDRQDILWVGTSRTGLFRFDPQTGLTKQYKYDPTDNLSLSNNSILSITEDKSGNIFIGTYNGFNKFDRQKNRFTRYLYESDRAKRGSKSLVRVLSPTKSGLLWVATGEGLVIFNTKTEKYINLFQNSEMYANIQNETPLSIYEDHSGIIWVGTFSGELFKYDPNKIKFIHYKHSQNDPYSLSHDHILDIYEDSQETLWVGTWGGGLNECKSIQIYKHSPKWIVHKHNPLNPRSIGGNSVYNIYEDSKNTLWFSTSNGLFILVRPSTKSTNIILKKDRCTFKHESNISGYMYEDKQNNFWMGSGNGLYRFDRKSKSLTHYNGDPDNPESLGKKEITYIIQSRSGQLWIGTYRSGLYNFDPKNENFTTYIHNPENSNSLSGNRVYMIYEDKSGFLWITTNKGLNKLIPESGNFRHYNSNVGLPEDDTFAILSDSKNNFWISSGKGLYRFSPESEVVKSFDKEDGLPSVDFNPWGHKSKNGTMYFSSVYGLIAFHPDSIKYNDHIPKVVLTDLQIFNKSILSGMAPLLQKSISQADEIELTHNQSVFSFEFAALDLHDPKKNLYAYKMEGVDPDWVFTDASRRFATYTNLDPGKYTFRVKGSNNDGIWNEEGTSIKVIVLPPWWKTSWAYTFYLLLFISIFVTTWRAQVRRIHIKQQLKMEHFEAEKLKEVDHLKSRFFANISHEFRTPLTLILGPVRQMLAGKYRGNQKEQYKMIIRNGERLLQLINEILDLAKLESREMKLQVSETDIAKYLKGMVLSFSSWAEQKKINLKLNIKDKEIIGFIDRDKLEKIMNNLLSNAFKFTQQGGHIEVEITKAPTPISPPGRGQKKIPSWEGWPENRGGVGKDFAQIAVSNTGSGIPADQINKIFDRFYQSDNNYKKDSEGTGIGLALTKELVEVCRGEILVESRKIDHSPTPLSKRELFRTTFTILLPINKECFNEDELVDTPLPLASPLTKGGARGVLDTTQETKDSPLIKRERGLSKSSPLLLIVEDNPDVTNYICSFMENDYQIVTAENGNEGLKKVVDKYPDLVISDVMMPEMDGFELCRKIKSDERISHIPVILLTAKADLGSKINGLEFGADDYVTKPFEARELQIRTKNLIEQRRKLREKFSFIMNLKPEEIAASSMDEQLLKRLLHVFEEHIEEPDFSIEQLARETGMSRRHLNRKIQAITNFSTTDFIRIIRLQKAARLLKSASGTVAEIAYKVGFNNLSYFSKAFRKHFGKLPSDFLDK